MQRAAYADSFKGLFGRVFLAYCHKPGHFMFGDVDFLAPPRSEGYVCYFKVFA